MFDADGGTTFGMWPDATSRLIYHDVMPALLSGVDRSGLVLDLGGGNGLARTWFPNVVTVDLDTDKRPDVVADVRSYVPEVATPDLVLMRYLLHYLSDSEVIALLAHVATYCSRLLVIQFVNDDLVTKARNSLNEVKWFRTEHTLRQLVCVDWRITRRVAVDYYVDPEFYVNRLNHPNPTGHSETVVAYTCEART